MNDCAAWTPTAPCYEGQDYRELAAYTCIDIKRIDENKLNISCSSSSASPGLVLGSATCHEGSWEFKTSAKCKSAAFSVWRVKFPSPSSSLSELQFSVDPDCSTQSLGLGDLLFPAKAKDLLDGDLRNSIFGNQISLAFNRKISVQCIRGFVDSLLPLTVDVWTEGTFKEVAVLPPARNAWSMVKVEKIDFAIACPDVSPPWPLRLLGGGKSPGVLRTVVCQPGFRQVDRKFLTTQNINTITCSDGSWTAWPNVKCIQVIGSNVERNDVSYKTVTTTTSDSHSGITLILYAMAALFAFLALLFLLRRALRWRSARPGPTGAGQPRELTELLPTIILEPDRVFRSEQLEHRPLKVARPLPVPSDAAPPVPRFAFPAPTRPVVATAPPVALPRPASVAPSVAPSEAPLSARSNASVGIMRSTRVSYRQSKN